MKNWAILAFCLLLTSCSRNPQVPITKQLTGAEVREIVENQFMPLGGSYVIDSRYAVPSKGWAEGNLKFIVSQFFIDNGVVYKENEFDCDDMSLAAKSAVSLNYTKSAARVSGASIPMGVFFYKRGGFNGHSINFILVENGGKIETLFFEPQGQKFLILSNLEKDSCLFWFL